VDITVLAGWFFELALRQVNGNLEEVARVFRGPHIRRTPKFQLTASVWRTSKVLLCYNSDLLLRWKCLRRSVVSSETVARQAITGDCGTKADEAAMRWMRRRMRTGRLKAARHFAVRESPLTRGGQKARRRRRREVEREYERVMDFKQSRGSHLAARSLSKERDFTAGRGRHDGVLQTTSL